MISLSNVRIDVGENTVFRGLNCDFPAGKITAIKKTGVLDGSSTLLKCCAGVTPPTSGEVMCNRRPVAAFTEREKFASLCYCYEHGGLISLFTVFNNIAMPLIYHKVCNETQASERIQEVAQTMGIADLLHLEPRQLNDVQTRLVNLLRALVINAGGILVDELQSGMPQSMLNSTVDILRRRAEQGTTVIMVTTSGDDDSFADRRMQIINQSLETAV